MSAKFKLIYSPKYHLDIGNHVFPTTKYHLIYKRLLKENLFNKEDFIFPIPATEDTLLLAHTKEYIRKVIDAKLSFAEILLLELPYSKELVEAQRICVDGTVQCCLCALKDDISIHIGGGFHHAFADHGEGFCVFNDIAIAIRKMQKESMATRAMVIDCDLHHGNGTASIFHRDKDVFTFSIHQENNYPVIKPASNIDVGLYDNTNTEEYLRQLKKYIPRIIKEFRPDIVLYIAGADVYKDDQLGGLSLSVDGLEKRDNLIFNHCKSNNIPVAVVLGGGYARDIMDTVCIHYNTIKAARNELYYSIDNSIFGE